MTTFVSDQRRPMDFVDTLEDVDERGIAYTVDL